MFTESIFTVEEVAQHLQVSVEAVLAEIEEGRLKAFPVGEKYTRIPESALNAYKKQGLSARAESKPVPINLNSTADFIFRWPKEKVEYTSAQEGIVQYDGRNYHVKVGFESRRTAGKLRRRALVLVDRYPTVEFVARDTAENSPMVSIIKDRRGKHVPEWAASPPEYAEMPVSLYRDIVDGPGAYNGLAVICNSGDLTIMVRHALIRCKYRQERSRV